jgi:hypothetical protein
MAAVAKSGTPSLASLLPPATNKISGLICGEDIAPGDFVYVSSAGLIMRANGTAANAAARVRGVALFYGRIAQNDPVTILHGVVIQYGAGLTPGADYYLSAATPGALSDVATTGGLVPVAYAVDATRIFVMSPN